MANQPKNVFGEPLIPCCMDPVTGFYRDGFCRTGADDVGLHLVCGEVTADFLEFSKQQGNDLSTPIPEYDFAGLKEGDFWCLCASRWEEARIAKKAPDVVLEATNIKCLEILKIEDLTKYRFKKPENK